MSEIKIDEMGRKNIQRVATHEAGHIAAAQLLGFRVQRVHFIFISSEKVNATTIINMWRLEEETTKIQPIRPKPVYNNGGEIALVYAAGIAAEEIFYERPKFEGREDVEMLKMFGDVDSFVSFARGFVNENKEEIRRIAEYLASQWTHWIDSGKTGGWIQWKKY